MLNSKSMKKNILYVLLIFIFIACDLTKEDKKNTVRGDIVSIPITEMETDYGKLSDFAEDIKMIPLEFSGDCILDKVEKIVMSDSCIFIMERYNQKGIYVFDHSGKYLYRVGNLWTGT